MSDFKFNLGDTVEDKIAGFRGVVICRTQWIYNCNVYGVQPEGLKDDKPGEREHFDEYALDLVEAKKYKTAEELEPGGPEKPVFQTNR